MTFIMILIIPYFEREFYVSQITFSFCVILIDNVRTRENHPYI